MNKYRFALNLSSLWYQPALRTPEFKLCQPLGVTSIICREKGHSKWQNIRHTKEAKDREKSVLFNGFIRMMKLAIVEGGGISDPESNSKLAQIVDNAKRHNMPAATIQNVLKGSKEKPMQSIWFEVKGPKGSILYISTLSLNSSLTRQAVKATFKKLKNVDFNDGIAKHAFEYKGFILAEPPPDMKNVEEMSIDHAIESGAEEVLPVEGENLLEFVTPANTMHVTRQKLEDLKYVIKDAEYIYIPRISVELSDEDLQTMTTVVDKLEAVPEVVAVYTNF